MTYITRLRSGDQEYVFTRLDRLVREKPSGRAPDIVVVGSANLDLVVTVPSLPQAGETVLATDYREFVGGKGANQAVAASRLGRDVAFVGRIGRDSAGATVRDALIAEEVDVSGLAGVDESTGRAFVQVDGRAENSITVVAGANAGLTATEVNDESLLLGASAVVVAQLEVPVEAVMAAARATRGVFVLNPAPAARLDDELLALVDVLVVNEGEFELVTSTAVEPDPVAMTGIFAGSSLPSKVVVTLGGRGALVRDGESVFLVPAPAAEVVDTTGAGDTFVGALADALSRDRAFPEAVRWAVCAATLSTQSLGATTAMPSRADVEALQATHCTSGGPVPHESCLCDAPD